MGRHAGGEGARVNLFELRATKGARRVGPGRPRTSGDAEDYAGRTPALAAYIELCRQRPSVQRSGWLDTFAAFVREHAPEPVVVD